MTKRTGKKIFNLLMISFCVSFSILGIATAAAQNAKVNASVSSPSLRGAYQNPNNVKLEGDVSLARGKQIISVSLRDSDVKQALRMFADKAGLNIIFHSSVAGKITLDLVNVTLNDAFKMIMQMSELTYIIQNDTILVMSTDASKKVDVSKENMSIIPVKYLDAGTVAQFLNTNIFTTNRPGLSNDQIAVINPAKNEILIFGTDNDYKMAKRIVDKLDVKPEVTTFKVNHTTPKEMANLICQALVNNNAGGADAASTAAAADTSGSSSSTAGLILGGGVVACKAAVNVKTDRMASLLNTGLSVVYQSGLGAVSVVGGSVEQIKMISDFITKNDRKQPQAYIEFSVIELSEDGSKTFNNNWGIASNSFTASFGSNGLQTVPSHPIMWKGNSVNISDGTSILNASKYTGAFTVAQSISYLITNGKGRVLANPKVMVTNGKKSTIDLTSDYIQSTTSQIIQNNGVAGAVQKTYTIAKDNGMKIELTPFISPDGYVSLNLKPEYSTIKEQVPDVGADGKTPIIAATLLQRRNLDLSNVRIKDGETLVIGGLIQETEQQSVTKMPILGDLPVVGVFFRNQQKKTNKSELVIMITPRIVVDTEDVTRL